MSAMMRGMEMQELTNEELEGVSGGNGQACAETMITWGSVGGSIGGIVGGGLGALVGGPIGGIGGGLFGLSVGAAIGGGLAARYVPACQAPV